MTLNVNVIWLIDIGGYGGEFYGFLFRRHKGIHARIIEDRNLSLPPMQNSIIVFNRSVEYNHYLTRYARFGIPFVAVMLSDEYLRDNRQFFRHRMCRLTFRSHYDPKLSQDSRVFTIPLGWRDNMNIDSFVASTGFSNRPYDWSFVGDPYKSDRQRALSQLSRIWPDACAFTHFFKGFNSPDGFSPISYAEVLLKSKFVLCPRGWVNLETFRVYEALEAGAIPITLSFTRWQPERPSYWIRVFGEDPPFIHKTTWKEAILEAKRISQDSEEYNRLHNKCTSFWRRYKKKLHFNAGIALRNAFGVL